MNSDNGHPEEQIQHGKAGRAQRFEDIIAWQKARIITRKVYEITRTAPFVKDFALSGQAQKASVSIMANIAEGFDRRGSAEFLHFLSYARGSCGELRSHLYVAFDCGYISEEKLAELLPLAEEVARVTFFLIASINRSKATSKTGKDTRVGTLRSDIP